MEQIKICISSLQEFQFNLNKVLDKLRKENDLANTLIQFADETFRSNESLLKKYLLLMIIRDAVYTNPIGSVTNKLANNNSLLNYLQEVVMFQPGSDDEYKGIYRFENDIPQIAIKYFNLILELIKCLAEKYPATSSNKPTKFKILYDRLIQQGIIFPKHNLELTANVNEIEEAAEESQPVKRNQVQQIEPSRQSGIKQLEELQLEMTDQIETIWDMLYDQNCNPDGAKDMLQFYCDTFKESDAKLQQLEYELSDQLTQQQRDQIEILCNFIKIFNLKFNHFERNKTKNGFLEFQHAVLTEASKITKKNYTPSDAYQKSKIQPLSSTRQIGQDDTQDVARLNDHTQIQVKQQVVSQINYQAQSDLQRQHEQQIMQDNSKQVDKLKGTSQPQHNQYNEYDTFNQQNQFQQQQYDQQFQLNQQQQKQDYQYFQEQPQQNSFKPIKQNNPHQLETDYQQFEQNIPKQHQNYFSQDYYQSPTKLEGSSNNIEQYQDQFNQKPNGMKLTFGNGTDQEQDQTNKGSSQVQFKEIRNSEQQKYQQKQNDSSGYQLNSQSLDLYQKLSRSGYSLQMIDIWKNTCLSGQGNLFENELIRVYCTFGFQYQVLNGKNYLKISLFIFNKTEQNWPINIKFQGDRSTKFWIKQDNRKVLERELQYLIMVDECKDPIICKIQIENMFFNVLLPTNQFNFIDFFDLRPEIMQLKVKDAQFHKSQPFRLQVGLETLKKLRFAVVNDYYGNGLVLNRGCVWEQ
ncbi:unnamed protein product (macronuclear) [Paramecium tetraurelia]|uniref:Uncharacterized protein n=1 Tax=Paramecium tetraurelia TaxID=5888 RepID=A0BHH5_PARTE|nr:uncharacterized protein GSPATT00029027001 [Paramecium tetraurelia]CAK57992.1 unnamed protein product [Paramecium tetraurelia]|eukprot:XP_001425390.1 hypothetical protein (macronuclear) [Paramecium tetraurelia strain d4-2]